jgi:hypothetical protein
MVAGHSTTGIKLVRDIDRYVAPLSVEEAYGRAHFVVEPILKAARRAGAVILDPTSSMCLDGLCPVIDPAGYPAFFDSDHYRSSYMAAYGSFLDVTVGIHDARKPVDYCV